MILITMLQTLISYGNSWRQPFLTALISLSPNSSSNVVPTLYIWFTPEIKHKINQVHTLRRKYRSYPTFHNATKFSDAEANLQTIMSTAKVSYENKLVNNLTTNGNNEIYRYIASLSKQSSIPSCMHYGSRSSQTSTKTAKLFNEYFYSVFNKNTSHFLDDEETIGRLIHIHFSPTKVWASRSSLDCSKTHGVDNLDPKVLKHCVESLSVPIFHLFRMSISYSQLPFEWKIHQIIPVYKTGDRFQVNNYHPILLLCIISKVLKWIIYNHTSNFIFKNISNQQFGFIPGHSSLQQLLTFVNILLEAKDHKTAVDVIHLDICKAFDTIPHHKLLAKLQKLGISGDLLRWFQAYLTNWSQCVSIDGKKSNFLPVMYDIPQWSILGPLLFDIYINDLPKYLQHSIALMFADNTKCIKPIHDVNDIVLLQEDIHHAMQWSSSCDMAFNVSKFIHMNYWSNSLNSSYCINSHNIMLANQCKDLGIIFTSNLNWSSHIEMIISWAYKILGLLRINSHQLYECKKAIIPIPG